MVCSDEFQYPLFQNDSQHWVWYRPKEKYNVDFLLSMVKQGNPSVIFINNKFGPN